MCVTSGVYLTDQKLRIDLFVLLPEIADARDACVHRLESLLGRERGIEKTHVVGEDGQPPQLCLHFDPRTISIAQVERLAKAAGAKLTEQFDHAVIPVRVTGGEDEYRRVEQLLCAQPDILSASVNQAAQVARVEFDRTQTSLDHVRATLREAGFAPTAESKRPSEESQPKANWYARNKELTWSIARGVLLLVAWVGERWLSFPRGIAVSLFVALYAFGGFDIVHHLIGSLRKRRFTFDIDLLMIVAAIGAAILGAWAEGAFLLFLFSLAHALEHYALGRARNAIRALSDLAPPVARVQERTFRNSF